MNRKSQKGNIVKKFGHGMMIVFITNIISMIFNVLLNFIEPRFLSVETYASIKTFALYMSATGIFHLGYLDGTYLKFGGKNKNSIDTKELNINLSSLRIFQLVVSIFVLVISLLLRDKVFLVFAFLLLPYNMTMYFRLFYQAIGEFNLYGKIMNASTAILFFGNLILIFILKQDFYLSYLKLYVFVYLIVWFVLEIDIRRIFKTKFQILYFSIKEFLVMLKSGFFIMLGNFSSIFLTSMDRWFVKMLLNSIEFAGYSFAVSIESLLNVAISPFTVTLYNFFCIENDKRKIQSIHNCILIFASLIVACAYPVKFILEIWLPDYLQSVGVMFLLFGSQIFMIIIKSVYVNLYKAQRRQREYFIKLVSVLFTGFIFNCVCFYFWRVKEAMALGTLFSAILWFILCQKDFKEICYDSRHYLYLIVTLISFIVFGNIMPAIWGCMVYLCIVLFGMFLLIRSDVVNIIQIIRIAIK